MRAEQQSAETYIDGEYKAELVFDIGHTVEL